MEVIAGIRRRCSIPGSRANKNWWIIGDEWAIERHAEPKCNASVTGRWTTVLLTIAAWLLLSNHCALGLGARGDWIRNRADVRCTPRRRKESRRQIFRAAKICARSLLTRSRISRRRRANWSACRIMWRQFRWSPPRVTAQLLASDTGPPHSLSFAESILQRSILAHAPPAGSLGCSGRRLACV